MASLPRAILFDLDDTLIRAYAQPEEAWTRLLHVFAAHLDAHDAEAIDRVRVAVMEEARAFWTDRRPPPSGGSTFPARGGCRCVAAWLELGRADEALADRIADAFTEMRRDEYRLYPDAHATVDALRDAGVKLALVTNGAAETQRAKIERFELGHRFDHIQIEGEFGQGKPELAVYRHALERLEVEPAMPGWSATITNGKSWRRSASACAASGTTRSTPACRRTPRPSRRASSSGWPNWSK